MACANSIGSGAERQTCHGNETTRRFRRRSTKTRHGSRSSRRCQYDVALHALRDSCQYLGNLARDNYFGELYYARARSVRRNGIPAWNLGFIKQGGGAFRDMGVHVLDSAWWILGLPKPIAVLGAAGAKFGPRGRGYWNRSQPPKETYKQYESDDYAGGFITFENGLGLQVESFWASHQPDEFQIELFGTDAGATMSPLRLYRTDESGTSEDISVNLPPGKYKEAWDAIADHFIECILDDVKCKAPLRHGLIVQQMMEGLLKSAETGREVHFFSYSPAPLLHCILIIRKALNEVICLLSVFSHTRLRRCCRLLSLVKVFQYATLSLPQGKIKK